MTLHATFAAAIRNMPDAELAGLVRQMSDDELCALLQDALEVPKAPTEREPPSAKPRKSGLRQAVLDAIGTTDGVGFADLVTKLGASQSGVHRVLQGLLGEGAVVRDGKAGQKGALWRLA